MNTAPVAAAQPPAPTPPSQPRRLAAGTSRLVAVLSVGLLPLLPPVLHGKAHPAELLVRYAPTLGLLLTTYGLTVYWLVPRLLLTGRVATYLLLTAALTALVTFSDLLVSLRYGPARPPAGAPLEPEVPGRSPRDPLAGPAGGPGAPPPDKLGYRLQLFTTTLLMMGLSAAGATVRHTRRQAAARLHLEQQKAQAELALLRAQLNPHLFFNTLNSIYWLTETDVEQARAGLYRLSRLLRYALYQTQAPLVPLSQEIQFLHDYVGLMQLRLPPTMRVVCDLPLHPADDGLVAPLLVLPLLENAFKHGVSTDEPATISIALHHAAGTLDVRVRNRIFAAGATALAAGSGIGLANTRRRLDLLYPGAYALAVGPDPADPGEFVAHLRVALTQPASDGA